MNLVRTAACLALVSAVTGCAVYTPHHPVVVVDPQPVVVVSPAVVVPAPAGRGFCPPGQAKKGNC